MSKCAFCPSELTTGDVDGICASCRNAGFGSQFKRRSQPFAPYSPPFTPQFPPPFPPSFPPQDYPIPSSMGWTCPKCGAVYAPFVRTCDYCGPQTRTTDSTQLSIDFDG